MKNEQSGFTLVELITVILLIGILSAVAFSRFPDNDLYQQSLFAKKIQTYLRLAQQVAIAQSQTPGNEMTATASLVLKKTSAANWQVTIDNRLGAEQFTLTLNTAILVNEQPLEDLGITLSFAANGDLIENSLQQGARVSTSIALQIGNEAVCIAPTGFSYAGACI